MAQENANINLNEIVARLEVRMIAIEKELANHKAAIEFISTCHMTPLVKKKLGEILSGKQIDWY